MIHKDLPWLVRSYFNRFKLKASDPRAHYLIVEGDIRLRTRRVLFVQVLLFLLAYGLAAFADASSGDARDSTRDLVLAIWLLAVVAYFLASLLLPRVRSALVAQLSLAVSALPLAIALLVVGFQASLFMIGPSAIVVVSTAGAVLAILLWKGISLGRIRFRELVNTGEHSRLLQLKVNNWSPHVKIEDSMGKLGCIGLALAVSGPAIGMNLHRVIGRSNVNIVLAILPIFLGVIYLYGVGYQIGTYLVEMRRIELDIGHPLILPPYGEDIESPTA